MKENKNIMRNEIQKRLDDEMWDLRIAGSVMEKRKRSKFRLAYGLSFSTLTAAASLFIIMSTFFNGGQQSLRYDSFISEQVRGTYGTVFASSAPAADYSPDDDMLSMQSIDSTIDDALAMR